MLNIQLIHGSGGRAGQRLIREVMLKYLGNPQLNRLEDQAVCDMPLGRRLAFTTDSYVIRPIFFPGGDIGRLAVCGTVNDLAVGGADPLYLSLGLIIEEGLPLNEFERIMVSIREACQKAGVRVITGDTKVVEKGAADKIFINTAGIGTVPADLELGAACLQPGDKIILSGNLADHALVVMAAREGLGLESTLRSDVAPLNGLTKAILNSAAAVRAMRDPTRGGLAALLNEWAKQGSVSITVDEKALPFSAAVRGGCDLLGLDPLYMANEGKLAVAVAAVDAESLLKVMQRHPQGQKAAVIGKVGEKRDGGRVLLNTTIGSQRILTLPEGNPLPRIC